jgi:Na+-transporting methylmalonyl-CoA/oxaloacetate decarboxylase gamma subunit
MTKKQVLFWRIILIFIIVLGGYFATKNFFKNKVKGKSVKEKLIPSLEKEKTVIEIKNEAVHHNGEIELSIRPNDFYKEKKDKN